MRIRGTKFGAGVGVVALLVFGTACGSSGYGASKTTTSTVAAGPKSAASAATSGEITIKGMAFTPDKVTAKVGQKITVHNDDSTAHTVTADNGTFDTKSIPSHGTATFTVSKAGTYPFHCNIHQFMKGSLTVS